MILSVLRPALAALLFATAFPAFAAFTDNGDGTVTDTVTGLMWDKCSWGVPDTACTGGGATVHTWVQALGVAVTANTNVHRGYTDWRLPNLNELESLVKIDTASPAIDTTAFPNTVSSPYWSSTTRAPGAALAWHVSFDDGYTVANNSSNTFYVRLVRSGQSFASFDLLDTAPTLSSVGVSATSSTGTTLSATSNEAATGYWVVLTGNGATAPSAAQVKAGQSSTGAAGVTSGNAAMTAATAKDFSVTGLTASTAYTVCVMAEDASANQSTVTCADVTTTAAPDTTAPTLSAVGVSATSSTGTTLSATSNEAATGYWVVLTGNGATAPSAAQVKAGQTSTGAAGVTSGNAAMTAATAKDFSVTGLAASTAYTVCVMAEDASANQSTVTCADVTTTAAPDTTAPTLSSVGVSATSSTGTTLSATSNEAATGYWIAVAQGSTAPSAAQVKAGVTYSGVTIVASGNAAMTAATPKAFSVTGLAASTAYTLYIVAEDGSTNLSTASSVNVTTSAVAVNGACGSANGLAFASTPASNLCTAGTPSTVSAAAGSYTWTCAGSGGGSTANCAATRSYTVSVSVGTGGSISPAGATVFYNAIQAFAISPASGYQLAAIAGCGGTLSGSNFTTAAITGDCTVTASFSTLVVTPTEPPPPPPPPPTLPSGGGDLSTAAGGTVIINNNGSAGSTLTLTGSGRTQINLGGGTITVDTTSTTRFTLVRTSDGSLALRVDDASFTVGGGNQPLLIAGGLALTGQGGNNSLRALYVGGKLKKLAVLTGAILLPGNGFAAASGQLHAGEVAEFDANERVSARYLGSLDGTAGQLGDRLPTFSNALTIAAGVPILTAVPERQRSSGQSQTLDRQLTQVLQPYGLGALGQNSQGVIRLVGNDTSLYSALPLGRVQVAEGEANGLTFNADGSVRVVLNGYAFLLVPAVVDPSGLANAMAAQRPGTSARLGSEGEWRFTESNGNTTVVRPGWGLSPATGGAGLGTDASGNLFYGHDSLFGSTLYPALADRARILAAARQLDPAATLTSVVGGETVLVLSGQRYVLSPESVLVEVPAVHANDPFWVAGGKLFVPAGEGRAQGFGLR